MQPCAEAAAIHQGKAANKDGVIGKVDGHSPLAGSDKSVNTATTEKAEPPTCTHRAMRGAATGSGVAMQSGTCGSTPSPSPGFARRGPGSSLGAEVRLTLTEGAKTTSDETQPGAADTLVANRGCAPGRG